MAFIDSALQAAGAALSFLQTNSSGQQGAGAAKGLAGITAFVNQVLTALDNIAAQVANIPVAQRRNAASSVANQVGQLVASLSDPAQVYQAKKGKDAAALAQGKTAAAQKAQQITALLQGASPVAVATSGGVSDTVLVGGTVSGNNANNGNAANEDGITIDNQTLLYGGLALVAILLLKKK